MDTTILAHWHQSIQPFSFSTQEFYERLGKALERRQMPDATLSRTNLPEGGLLSAYRDYLLVKRGKLTFNLCAAPFGIDFFVSWWLTESPGCLGCLTAVIPFLGIFARKPTFYEEDTAIMFREAVHAAVTEVLTDILGEGAAERVAKMPAPTIAKSPLV